MESIQQKMHFKETSPEKTVEKIKKILEKNNIEVEELWKEKENLIGTYSVRINIKGTTMGTNGKGVSKAYAQASGYGEFLERYQCGLLIKKDYVQIKEFESFFDIDEVEKTTSKIIEENNAFIRLYFQSVGLDNSSYENKLKYLRENETLELIIHNKKNSCTTIPFYNIKEKKLDYLPRAIYQRCYGSNGMCAGNTPEEAIVQGIAEIFERVSQKRVFRDKIALPDIPEEYIQKFPEVYKMYKNLQSNNQYEVILKDCSFGGKYPVAALLVIEKNTGNYGVRFGCHPDYGIAMERTFTEATQGQDISKFARMNVVDFSNQYVDSVENISNSFKVGLAKYPYQFLQNKSKYSFSPFDDVSGLDNKNILKNWINNIINDGHDILIRDHSILGFPSYHVIIPGLSELKPITKETSKLYNTRAYITNLLNDVRNICSENCKYIAAVIRQSKDSILENDISSYFPMSDEKNFPGNDLNKGAEYLASMCHIMSHEYDKAEYFMNRIVMASEYIDISMERKTMYQAIRYYCQAMNSIKNHESVIEIMHLMYDTYICNRLDDLFCKPDQVINLQYLNASTSELGERLSQRKFHMNIIQNAKNKSNIKQQEIGKKVLYNLS